MMRHALLAAAAAAAAAVTLPGIAATPSNETTAKPSARPQARAGHVAERPARRAARRPPRAEIGLPAAEAEQLAAASLAYFGEYRCEFDKKLVVSMNPRHEAYLDVAFRNRVYTMKPVLSHTGALRLEDVRGRMLVVQIATKSMMMDTRLGQRVVDGCMNEQQRLAAAEPPSGEGLGIDPERSSPAAPEAVVR